MRRRRAVSVLLAAGFLLAGCSQPDSSPAVSLGTPDSAADRGAVNAIVRADSSASNDEAMGSAAMSAPDSGVVSFSPPPVAPSSSPAPAIDVLPGMPPVVDPHNIYSEAGANMLGPVAQQSKAYAYVPDTKSGDVWVIDQRTFQVVNKFPVGKEVQHVVPSHDMTALYATDDVGNVIRRIDPITGLPGDTIAVADPYNMYFTPDGRYAISVAEDLRSLIWYDPVTWQEVDRVQYPDCQGLDHGDFTPDGKIAVFSCERRARCRRRHAIPPADSDGGGGVLRGHPGQGVADGDPLVQRGQDTEAEPVPQGWLPDQQRRER